MKKRIIISVNNDIAFDQRMQKTAKSLSNFGYDVIIVGRKNKVSADFNPDVYSIYRFKLLFSKGKIFYIEYQIKLFLYLLFHKSDMLCAVDLDTILPNVLAGKIYKTPIVYDAHEYFTEVPELTERQFEKSVWKWVEKLAFKNIQAVYTVSDGIAHIFEKEYGIKCEIIYNFPNKAISHIIDNQKRNYILYQGDLNEGRGLDIAIIAMKDVENYQLWIAGDGYDKSRLKDLVFQNKLEDKVVFLGKVNPQDLLEITKYAKIGLNLLENKGLNHYYSLANKFFDYTNAGVPTISMNFPEYARMNEQYHCAILLNNLDLEEYLKGLNLVLNNENIYHQLVKNCDIARCFLNWENQEEKLSSIYKNVETNTYHIF